ncbi:MAG TPA: (deoxy)nucleoside triphosphate pyrophosphohydrolase [Pseudonocardia sp.]
MPVLYSRVRLDACTRAVAGILRDTQLVESALARSGHAIQVKRRLLTPGDEIRISARLAPGVKVLLRTSVDAVSLGGLASSLVSGPLSYLEHVATIAGDGALLEVHDEVRWAGPLLTRRCVRDVLAARAHMLTERVAALAETPVIVATALLRDGRVLIAQRTRPAALAGLWELPGGRVEPGESEAAAVARECHEELGARVSAVGRVGTDLPIDAGVLRVHTARLEPGSPEPTALEHAGLRWLGPTEMDAVAWVEADQAVVADLRDLLTTGDR